jgi:hypothetical protein
MDPVALLVLAALAGGAWYLSKPVEQVVRPVAVVEPPPPPQADDVSKTLDTLADFVEAGPSTGSATLAGLELSQILVPDVTAVETALAAGGITALLGGGPAGVALAITLAVYAQQEQLMAEVDAFKAIRFMVTRAEYDKWKGMKSKSTTFPTSLEASVHRTLHEYEVKLTKKYSEFGESGKPGPGQLDFATRLSRGYAAAEQLPDIPTGFISPWGVSWMLEQGILQDWMRTSFGG